MQQCIVNGVFGPNGCDVTIVQALFICGLLFLLLYSQCLLLNCGVYCIFYYEYMCIRWTLKLSVTHLFLSVHNNSPIPVPHQNFACF